jgi:hypothetical protein
MANSPFAFKKRLLGPTGPLTPTNSPSLKPSPRAPSKPSSHSSTLSIETVLGSTTSTPCGFDCLPSARLFVYCAASSVVLGRLEDDLSITRRYFRANPTVASVNPFVSYYQPSTPVANSDARARTFTASKAINAGAASPAYLNGDRTETASSRALNSRDRIKASTSVSLSPDGKLLAVGEVCT